MSAALPRLDSLLGLDLSSKFLKVGRDLVPNRTPVGQFHPRPQAPVVLEEPASQMFYFVDDLPGQILFPVLGRCVVFAYVLLD